MSSGRILMQHEIRFFKKATISNPKGSTETHIQHCHNKWHNAIRSSQCRCRRGQWKPPARTDKLRITQQRQLWFATMYNEGCVTSGWKLQCMLILDVSQQALREICCQARTQPLNAIIIPRHSNWHGQNILQAQFTYNIQSPGRAELAGCRIILKLVSVNLWSPTRFLTDIQWQTAFHGAAVKLLAGQCYCSTL